MQTPSDVRFMAPAPDGVATATVQTVGDLGLGVHYYWIVSHFPIGSVVSEPFAVWNAPQPLNASNYVLIVWEGTPGVITYDLLRTETPEVPAFPGNYALATNLTVTQYQDQGQVLTAYDLSGLPRGAPVTAHVLFNNRDYVTPTLEFPVNMKVLTLIYPDGSMQGSAAGVVAPTLVAGTGITVVDHPGPPHTVTISSTATQTPWVAAVDGANHNLGNVNAIGIGGPATGAKIQTTGTTPYEAINASSTGAASSIAITLQNPALGTFSMRMNPALPEAEFITNPARAFAFISGTANSLYISAAGNVGIGNFTNVSQPAYDLDVQGDCNITGQYRVAGVPLSVQGEAFVGPNPPPSANEGRFWFDGHTLKLFIRFSNTWIGLN